MSTSKSKMININTLKALLDKMNFYLRAVLAYLAGIMCHLVCEMEDRDISLNDILKELQMEFGYSEYAGLLMYAGGHYLHHRFSIETGHSEEEEALYTYLEKNSAGILFMD